jgi:hypothetical protein
MPNHPPLEMLKLFCSYEMNLHNSSVRSDKAQLQKLLHADFMEVSRSGQCLGKASFIEQLLASKAHPAIWAQDFELSMPSYSVAQLVYRSAQAQDSALRQHEVRSSLWQLTEVGWQLRLHQATPCEAFAKAKLQREGMPLTHETLLS